MAFYTHDQLVKMGFPEIGENVLLSDKASYYNCKNIHLGSNIRVDDFCVLSAGEGGIYLEGYNHIACYSSLIGQGKIVMKKFAGLSSKVSIYSSTDDYTGSAMSNPTVPVELCNVKSGDVILEKHVLIGAGTVILPGVILHEGVAVGALSLINKSCESFSVYFGSPAKKIKNRKRDLLEKELLIKK